MATSATLYGNSGGSGIAKTINLSTPFNSDVTTVTADDNVFWTKATIQPKTIRVSTVQASNVGDYTASFTANTTINKLLGVEVYLIGNNVSYYVNKSSILGMFLFPADDSYVTSGSTGFSVVYASGTSNNPTVNVVTDTHYAATITGKTLTIARTDSFMMYRFYHSTDGFYYYATIHYV